MYKYKIEFDPPPDTDISNSDSPTPKSKKRKNVFEDFGISDKKNKYELKEGRWQDIDNGELLVYDSSEVKPSKKVKFLII